MKRLLLLVAAIVMITAGAAVPIAGATCVLDDDAPSWCEGFMSFIRGPAKVVLKPMLATGVMPIDLLSSPLAASGFALGLYWFFTREPKRASQSSDDFNLDL